MMKSTKHQHPSIRETSSSKLQVNVQRRVKIDWSLVLGASLEFGTWNLALSSELPQ
jgi:hypothetical protein